MTQRPFQQHPKLPSSLSFAADGRLKNTPANRALNPDRTSQQDFTRPDFVSHAAHHDTSAVVFCGDASATLEHMANKGIQVDCIVTSPPFYGQRDYGVDGQIGLEPTPGEYINALMRVFELCREVLRDTGSLWVNLGDTYWSGKGAQRSSEAKQGARRFGVRPQDLKGDGVWTKPKQLLLIPHRFAIAMQEAGWLVRNDNVWVKPSPVPDQVRDRCAASHEYVFHFTKSRWYYFDRTAVGRETPTNGKMMPPKDTWVVPTANRDRGTKSQHRAAFSEELVRIPILGSTPKDGVVLDPFVGSGTSMLFAKKHGFRSIGIDLNAGYCEHVIDRLTDNTRVPYQHNDEAAS